MKWNTKRQSKSSLNSRADSLKKNWLTASKTHKERTLIKQILNERIHITIDITEIQRIIRYNFEKLYATKWETLGKIYKCLDSNNLPKLKQKDMEHLNRPITSKKIKQ